MLKINRKKTLKTRVQIVSTSLKYENRSSASSFDKYFVLLSVEQNNSIKFFFFFLLSTKCYFVTTSIKTNTHMLIMSYTFFFFFGYFQDKNKHVFLYLSMIQLLNRALKHSHSFYYHERRTNAYEI
jgi:hypothetical protein